MKKEFILLAIQPEANLRELFRRYGISAPCGYKWLRAYRENGFAGLEQKSRRPRSHPDEIGTQMQTQILSLRDKQPAWGGRKLKRRLEDLGVQRVPAASTITEILRRNGRLNMAHCSAQGPWRRFECIIGVPPVRGMTAGNLRTALGQGVPFRLSIVALGGNREHRRDAYFPS